MVFAAEKLRRRMPEILGAALRATLPVEDVQWCVAPGAPVDSAMAPPPAADDAAWQPLRPGQLWGGAPGVDLTAPRQEIGWGIPVNGGGNHWLRARLRLPEAWSGHQVLLGLVWEGKNVGSLEAIAYLDGEVLSGFDEFHRTMLLPESAHSGSHELIIRCYVPYSMPFGGLFIHQRDTTLFRLGHMLNALLEVVETASDTDGQRHVVLQAINDAYNLLDLREGFGSERLAQSASAALERLHQIPSRPAGATPEAGVPSVLATGHAHLDVAWLWPLWRTRQKVAHTVANALHLMERYPEYHFSMSQPQVYEYLKHDDPALYERMKQRAAEGRFEQVGLMWLETDCNVTSGESLVRQLQHGARFFGEEFGEAKHVCWLPDVFGYSAALPQLLRQAGVDCFMTTKISWSQFNRPAQDTFRWRGIDGTEVLAHFVTTPDPHGPHYTYVGHMNADEVRGLWSNYRQQDANTDLLYIYGWGDGGGGPTEDMLEAARVFGALPGFPQVRLGRLEEYFEQLYRQTWDNPNTPTWVGELYLEYHRGTYTSQARTKQQNRQAELLYRETEWLNAWASLLGAPNRQKELDAGWQTILLNQFHDIIPGSSIPQVYVDSNADYAAVREQAEAVRTAALDAIGGEDAGTTRVFNSLPWPRNEAVRLPLDANADAPDGAQVIEERPGERAALVATSAPAYGYALIAAGEAGSGTLRVSRDTLENDAYTLRLDENGEIASLFDKRNRRELVLPGSTLNQLVIYEDRPLQWNAWDIDLFYEEKPYPVRDLLDWQVVEEGPIRAAIQIVRRIGTSTITQRICLWRNSDRIDFITDVDWQERQMLLRALFPLQVNAASATCEIQYGAVERPTHRNTTWDLARFEVCAHRWVDIGEGGYGVALLNNGKYGHSLHNSTLGLSLLKGAVFPDPNADRGQHRFTYSLLPHAGDWRAAQVVRRAYELNVPLFTAAVGGERETMSFVEVDAPNVILETVLSRAENEVTLRLYEAHNSRGTARITFAWPVASAEEIDLLDNPLAPVQTDGNSLVVNVRPYEVKTLRVRLAK